MTGTGGQRTHSRDLGTAGALGRLWSSGDGGSAVRDPASLRFSFAAVELGQRYRATLLPCLEERMPGTLPSSPGQSDPGKEPSNPAWEWEENLM